MDRNEKLQYQQSIENYFEDKKVYDLLEKYFKDLIVNKPKDPLDYLIKRVKMPDSKRIFITGSAGTDRKELALSISNHFNFHCISLGDLIQKEVSKKVDVSRKIDDKATHYRLIDDDVVIELIKKEIMKLEKENSSYVVEGFPRNRVKNQIKFIILFKNF
jgi:adenylate kinase